VWIWGRSTDLWAFGGSFALAVIVAGLASVLAPDGLVPSWAWFVFVLGLDVAHVWSTLFRTYLDPEELRARPLLYGGLPVICYAAGVWLHHVSALTFWRVLAYAAVFHFVRQQVGWVAIYRARAGERESFDKWLDSAVVYAATGWPLLYWHAHLPRNFTWFISGDFVNGEVLAPLVVPTGVIYGLLLLAYAWRAADRASRGAPNPGKDLVVATTAVAWFVGIVATNQDFVFTITNVTVHAIPYFVLLFMYARERASDRPSSLIGVILRGGVVAFLTLAVGLAFFEELGWERLVWHDRPGWFGGAPRQTPLLGEGVLAFVVPALALPQAVHYALDGMIWRSKDARPAQARALGFAPRAPTSAA
jgi:hypothetical protein